MEQRYVGRSGLLVSRLGLGTLTWGRDTDVHEAADQLHDFVEAGGTLVDTGAAYGAGAAEEVLGELLATKVDRQDLVLCVKAGDVRRPGRPDVSRRGMLSALEGSLRRLRTDHVDLWLVPAWNDDVPLEETLSALEAAVRDGRARYAGVANFTGWQAALAATLRPGAGTPVLVQSEYSLVQRAAERELVPCAQALGLGMMAWSPLGRGVLTGKYRNGTPADSRGASAHLAGFVAPYLAGPARRVVDAVVTAAEGLGCEPLEVALAWARDRPWASSVIVGARTAAQLRASLAGDALDLPEEIRQVLDEISATARG